MSEITIHANDETKTLTISENITLLEALHKHGHAPESPCSGKGICGKCRVQILKGSRLYTREEKKHLSDGDMQKGIHLSCMTMVTEDMEIMIPDKKKNASIMTEMKIKSILGSPAVTKRVLTLPDPSITDQRPDDARLLAQCYTDFNTESISGIGNTTTFAPGILPLQILQKLPNVLRSSGFQATTVEILGQITGIESGNTSEILYGVAIDVGTTTLAAYLYNLCDGKQSAVASVLNPQRKHGADVISRIDYSSKNTGQKTEMARLIRASLDLLMDKLVQDAGIAKNEIYLVTIAGNTTMLHLLAELPAFNIASAPFIPVTLSGLVLTPGELNLPINESGRFVLLPSVSAYVGADTVAAVLSAEMHRKEEITLMVDIGTNGEIVLGSKSSLYACSTAAGPAFEGANILCGIGGVEGALSDIAICSDGKLQMKTIGGHKPIGICGSGLIDAIACMLEMGIIDETGRIVDEDELPENAEGYKRNLIEKNNQPAFLLVPVAESGHGEEIIITQKDIREVQNAKAAIAAGIRVLIREAGYTVEQIHAAYLAGGFGSYMRIESALKIGLLPSELSGRIQAVGNAAGAGAICSLLSGDELLEADKIAKSIRYLELSSRPDFVSEYTDNMFFS